ncbi:hypothetical protein HNQ34_000007 [Anoxybacillus tepidamans]|uniref:Helicase HerA central domain-containing protein n=1 Tax=Anoxybacteroides tepidamans TaxID=265948 RepID=A0A7W8ILY3_9BACL|nr:ATP-binding protein [Anoxybacillus tepidamans]MBB5322930.1 hypothetical protein [Anoxybacillus tepidamans]
MLYLDYDLFRNLTVGTVESVSPNQIRVVIENRAPQSTALNTGTPTIFPRINGFVLIPNESGALVCIISWVGIESQTISNASHNTIINLPYPLRKMVTNPLGVLKYNDEENYEFERGVYNYPSVGDPVVIPTPEQLESIITNKDENANVVIGTAPIAANSVIKVNPDKLFGRHLAVLGNTGSGKSCSVAGLIRWSLEAAKENKKKKEKPINSRFLILDTNGEYLNTFDDICNVRKFKVKIIESDMKEFEQLRVPSWMWNSAEWSSIAQASSKTQRPILRRALRELRNGNFCSKNEIEKIRRYFTSLQIILKNDYNSGLSAFAEKPGKNEFGRKLLRVADDAKYYLSTYTTIDNRYVEGLKALSEQLNNIALKKRKNFVNKNGEEQEYFDSFYVSDVENAINAVDDFLKLFGEIQIYEGPNEDSPVPFRLESLADHIETIAEEKNVLQYLDFLVMRIRTMISDLRMGSIINTTDEVTLERWLRDYIGASEAENGEIAIIDLSLVPVDILHLVVAVISRIVFEALQRYRRLNGEALPTVLVLEEAHNYISKLNNNGEEEFSQTIMCCKIFEKIAREGRKFGLGLLISSQRPSELSQTILSQCNTFLLHRIVNDKDQELVKRLVPDNLGAMLSELPVLPTRKAIILGWAAPIPILVEMRELSKEKQPHSSDPDFWDVWTDQKERKIDWEKISKEWQEEN